MALNVEERMGSVAHHKNGEVMAPHKNGEVVAPHR